MTMSVIPWVACHPSTTSANTAGESSASHLNTANTHKKPLFLFMEGIDVNSPGGGHDLIVPRGGGEASTPPVAGSTRRGREGSEGGVGGSASGRRRSDGSMLFSSTPSPPPPPHRQNSASGSSSHRRKLSSSGSSHATRRTSVPSAGTPAAAAVLSHRPLEVVVYASLSFRNLLPVGVGWRVVGARGDAGAQVAEGTLGPGEGVHVLEANTMAMTPSLSFKVQPFFRSKCTPFFI